MGHLHKFLNAARERVAAGAYERAQAPLAPNGSLKQALLVDAQAIVAELKPRSPSEGQLIPPGGVDGLLRAYREAPGTALSVLADATFFDGSPNLVRQAHGAGLPVLWKDFVVDEAQVLCAAHNGASAILLIERAFGGQSHLRERLVAAAHKAGLEVVLELFDAADLATAANSAADLFGVNARDLDTLHVDQAAALRLVGAASHTRPTLALSGIGSRMQARAARAAGAVGLLVGTGLLRSPDPALALRALRRPLAKVCGLRTADDVAAAAAAGADLVGFVVGSPGSPRDVPPLRVQGLAQQAREAGLRSVLVTRSQEPGLVLEWCRLVRPDFVQLHGLEATADMRHRLANVPTRVLQGLPAGSAAGAHADGVVLDTTAEGGSGTTHAWNLAPPGFSLVAGGLAADNVARALQASQAWGADASSRLESAPGVKDAQRMREFVQAVHAA